MRLVPPLSLALIAVAIVPVRAAPPPPIADRSADMLQLAGGEAVLGMLPEPPGTETVRLYVARDWLRQHYGKLYRKLTADEDEQRKQALNQYQERLAAWLKLRPRPKLLADFIQRSLRDIDSRLAALDNGNEQPETSQLLIAEFPAKQVRRVQTQPPARRRLLALAWEARLGDAEQLSAKALAKELETQGVDLERAEPDLSDRFDIVPLSPAEWSAKLALVEFQILGKPRFQGTGGVLIEVEGGQGQPPVADLAGRLLQDQLGDALGDLFNPQPAGNGAQAGSKLKAASEKALSAAAERGATGVRITSLDQSLATRRVTVNDALHARMPDGSWRAIWQAASTVSTDEQDLGEDALAADPQVAEALKTVKALGLDENQDLMKSALRFGGATRKAMQSTERAFAEYLSAHTRRLIGPPVPRAGPAN